MSCPVRQGMTRRGFFAGVTGLVGATVLPKLPPAEAAGTSYEPVRSAPTIFVGPWGSDENDGLDWLHCKKTIAAALARPHTGYIKIMSGLKSLHKGLR